ncbi:protein disulfide-isomerase-like [Cucurbita pepo subsp. pepo]|uniref:protein disulfide-isomerase-like n=1 Tax=Cucurbita pepo subsp. pepo TaxID=3664 RepID=UPI000C9D5A3A|nr:protein disulfide-isomerase-like [Cucurbita pepo subsp. pepo]XP_023535803.1 protein disulfide-isomerase-like [Cucurbita pepo subsp. pepo]XP_023535804.1 protein disulfide-isomerase-like [Cucurbita pepo subsp. pepo]
MAMAMAMASAISLCFVALFALRSSFFVLTVAATSDNPEFVVELDRSNFTNFVSKLDFLIVSFYTPRCGHCKRLAPEYEKAANILSKHDPPLTLAKVNIFNEANEGLAGSDGTISIKIVREGGKNVQEYKGPLDADGIVEYVKRQYGPASVEINTVEDAQNFISDNKIAVVGIFPQFSGEEFENYTILAKKLRSTEEFFHTSDAKLLPRGKSSVTGPLMRVLKPFDELFVDTQDFDVDALKKFVEKSIVPTVTIMDGDKNNQRLVDNFMYNSNSKVMLFINFSSEIAASFEYKYRELAELYKGDGLSFLMADIDASLHAIKQYGVKDGQIPFIILLSDKTKYLKSNVEPDELSPWLKRYKNRELEPYIKSEPIPEHNDEPVKVVVSHTFQDIVFKSRKNVLLEFYAPSHKACKQLASVFEDLAMAYRSDPDVIIAKFDIFANDLVHDFEIWTLPTIYFKSADGNISKYTGYATKKDLRDFIEKNRSKAADEHSDLKDEL